MSLIPLNSVVAAWRAEGRTLASIADELQLTDESHLYKLLADPGQVAVDTDGVVWRQLRKRGSENG